MSSRCFSNISANLRLDGVVPRLLQLAQPIGNRQRVRTRRREQSPSPPPSRARRTRPGPNPRPARRSPVKIGLPPNPPSSSLRPSDTTRGAPSRDAREPDAANASNASDKTASTPAKISSPASRSVSVTRGASEGHHRRQTPRHVRGQQRGRQDRSLHAVALLDGEREEPGKAHSAKSSTKSRAASAQSLKRRFDARAQHRRATFVAVLSCAPSVKSRNTRVSARGA